MAEMKKVLSVDQEKSAKNLTLVVYILQALSFLTMGITSIVGVMINYIKWHEMQGTWLESHFKWQIRTFWFALLWAAIGFFTLVFFVGTIILIANSIWVIYRIVKGFLQLNDNKPIEF